jgi:hypothetical protein
MTNVTFQLLLLSSYQNTIHLTDTESLNIKIVAPMLSRIKTKIIIIFLEAASKMNMQMSPSMEFKHKANAERNR